MLGGKDLSLVQPLRSFDAHSLYKWAECFASDSRGLSKDAGNFSVLTRMKFDPCVVLLSLVWQPVESKGDADPVQWI